MAIKKKFQEERLNLETDKKRLTKELAENHEKIELSHNRFYALKTEVE